nr:hypothetical protein [Tanacetum cinerariifolium]
MSTQQDIYAAGSKNRPLMLNKENYVPWSSRLSAVDSCETAQEIWLRVQQMMKGSNIGIQEKNAKLFNEWERFTSTDRESIKSYYHRFLKLMNDLKQNKHFQKKIASNLKFLNNLQPEWSRHVTIVHQTKDVHIAYYTQLYDFLKYNQKEVDDLKAKRLARTQDPLALMATSNNPYTFPVLHQDQPSFNQNYMQQPMPNPEDITDATTAINMALALMAKALKLNYSTPTNKNQRISSNPWYNDIQNVRNQNPNGNGNLVAARVEGNASGHNGNQIRCYNCREVGHFARNYTVRQRRRDAAYLQTQLLIAQKEEAEIQLQAEEFDLMAAAADLDEIEEVNANCILMANLQQASTSGTQTDKAPVYDSDGSAEVHNYEDCCDNEIFNMFTQEEQYTELLEPIPETHQVPQNDNNIISETFKTLCFLNYALMIRHDYDITSSLRRGALQDKSCCPYYILAKFVGDFKSLAKEADESLANHKALELEIKRLLRAVVSQDIMSVVQNNYVTETSNLQTKLKHNTKTRRPQPRSNTKNGRVPSVSKSSRRKNKEVDVDEHHRKLLLSRNKKHMSSECNNVKLATKNVKSKVVCAMCKQCLISVNHDKCLLNYVNGMSSRGKKQKANVLINEKQKKQQPKVKKTKKVGSIKRLASPKLSKPRSFLRWSPTRRLFDPKGNIIASSKSESQSDCSKGDNACTSNPLEPTIKRFLNSTFSLAGYPNMFMFLGTIRFGNDHVAAILGFGDLQWGNILITRVYFIEGLGYNLLSVGQFCYSNLEVAFRRNACFVKNLEGVDLLSGNRTTNLYTINLHEMASATPICLMARASSTKSCDCTVCFTQNRSIVHHRFNKTPYDLINGRKPDISFLRVFDALCYPKNDFEEIGKFGAKGDIGFFIGYSADSCAFRVSKPGLQSMTSRQITMYDDYIGGQTSTAPRTVLAVQAHQDRQTTTTSTSIADTAPTPITSSSQATNFPNFSQDVDGLNSQQQHAQQQRNQALLQLKIVADNFPNAMFGDNSFVNPFANPSTSAVESSSSQYVDPSNMHTNQLRSDGDMCMYALTVSTIEPKNGKEVTTNLAWIESMQEELLQFKRLDVWVLVPALDNNKPLTLKYLFKNKHDEENTIIETSLV